MQGTEQAIICQELIFWFPHAATVADQHLMGRAVAALILMMCLVKEIE